MSTSNQISVSNFLGEDLGRKFVYRKAAAIVSVSVTVFGLAVFLLIVFDKGLDSFVSFIFSRSIFGPTQIMGLLAFGVWTIRYTLPALSIILKSGFAIYQEGNSVFFAGYEILLNQISHFEIRERFISKNIILVAKDGTERKVSRVFVRQERAN